MRSSELPGQPRGNLNGHGAVYKEAFLVLHGVKQAGIRATGANRQDHVALAMKVNGLAGGEIRSDDAARDLHLFEAVSFQKTCKEGLHALAGCESHPTEAPAADIGETHGAADAGYLFGLPPAGVSRCYDGARAYTCDAVNGDLVLFEDLQQPGVSYPTREAATQCNTDFGVCGADRYSQSGVLARKPAQCGNTKAANSKRSFPHRYS